MKEQIAKAWGGIKEQTSKFTAYLLPLTAVVFLLWLYLWPSGFDERVAFADLVVKIVGGTAAFLAVYFTWKRLDVSQRALEVSQEGQITERFSRAIDQLGSDRPDIKLGGIHALERIARDSPRDADAIIEVLTAHVRANSAWKKVLDSNSDGGYPKHGPAVWIPINEVDSGQI